MCDSGKEESFCERSKKAQSARKISRCARNDGMVYIAVCVIAENGKLSVKGARNDGVQERFLAALEMTVGGMGLFHVAYNGYVWKAPLPYRHPERSRGIFLAHRYSVLCATAENGNPSMKEARKRGVQGRFLAALEMTVGENGVISRSVQRICLESDIPVSSSRPKWRDLSCRRG